MLSKKNILQKTIEVGGLTLLSRVLGVLREVLMVRYLGMGALSDAFLTAYKIPNSLRKIFAEGALSAAFVPTIVQTVRKQDRSAINSIMTLGFLVFEGLVLLLCGLAMYYAQQVIQFSAPGFSPEQMRIAIISLQIVMPFIFFISSSALLAGALQSVGHFFVPAFSPVMLNIVFIGALLACLRFDLPVQYLCFFILCGGFIQFIAHLVAYVNLRFGFGVIRKQDLQRFAHIFIKFGSCLVSMSVMEVGLFFDGRFASYLSKGSVSIIYYANRFMGIPLGVFAVAFSTILLPHFSRVSVYAPRRLGFYLLESAKFIFWVTVPVALVMAFFAEKIFYTIFLSDKFSLAQVHEAGYVLQAFLLGLFFFALNKILLNLYYSLHVTGMPALIAAGATIINIVLNITLMRWWQATGIAFATSLAMILQIMVSLVALRWYCKLPIYVGQFLLFGGRYALQLVVLLLPFLGIYTMCLWLIDYLPVWLAYYLLDTLVFWLWVGPLTGLFFLLLYYLRGLFKIDLFFLD